MSSRVSGATEQTSTEVEWPTCSASRRAAPPTATRRGIEQQVARHVKVIEGSRRGTPPRRVRSREFAPRSVNIESLTVSDDDEPRRCPSVRRRISRLGRDLGPTKRLARRRRLRRPHRRRRRRGRRGRSRATAMARLAPRPAARPSIVTGVSLVGAIVRQRTHHDVEHHVAENDDATLTRALAPWPRRSSPAECRVRHHQVSIHLRRSRRPCDARTRPVVRG